MKLLEKFSEKISRKTAILPDVYKPGEYDLAGVLYFSAPTITSD